MKPGIYNFTIQQGDTFVLKQQYATAASETATRIPINLTGCTLSALIRKKQDPTSELLATFACVITSALEGKYELRLTAATTAALDFSVGYYDLQVTFSDSTKRTLLQGRVTLNKEVTNV